MRLLVCGGPPTQGPGIGRDAVFQVLDFLTDHEDVELLLHRGAGGSEAHAEAWAHEHEIASLRLPPQWKRRGQRAGAIRDVQLIHLKPELLVLLPQAPSTEGLLARAKQAGVMVARANERGEVTIEGL
jgi:hypothetical protein